MSVISFALHINIPRAKNGALGEFVDWRNACVHTHPANLTLPIRKHSLLMIDKNIFLLKERGWNILLSLAQILFDCPLARALAAGSISLKGSLRVGAALGFPWTK